MAANPFIIFPWHRPFLEDLKSFIEKDTNGVPGSALVIVPHKRPWRYFADLYIKGAKAAVLPKMLAFSDVVSLWSVQLGNGARLETNQLDIAALLYDIIKSGSIPDSRLKAAFAGMPLEKFLPWGLRLAALFDEIMAHGMEPGDISYAENEVSANAAAILGALGKISHKLKERLLERGWTTPGLANLEASRNPASIPPLLLPKPNRPVYIAGFYALNGTQDRLFHSLWEAGAKICLHTAPDFMDPEKAPRHVGEHAAWAARWNAKTRLAVEDAGASGPAYTFHAGYDVHSQLDMLSEVLGSAQSFASTAIVCARPDILMPILHHLPKKDVNISIGYPLARSPLGNFFDSILTAVESRHPDGRYYWKDLRTFLRHPYLGMLEADDGPLKPSLANLDNSLANGGKFVDLAQLLDNFPASSQAQYEALRAALNIGLRAFGEVSTTSELADALDALRILLLEKGAQIWGKFPLDAEALSALATDVIPVLRHNALGEERLPAPVLHSLFKRILEDSRVPFEADPITGLQVLGLLETRLLQFDHVCVMDATEDILPGQSANDPLLSDSLRGALGLPDSRAREAVIAHNLSRLCAGAKKARFFWQEGISQSQLFDAKKTRSRFVEELIWDEEKKRKKLLKNGEPPLYSARAMMRVLPRPENILERSPALNAKMDEFLKKPLSPTRLDEYLSCPLRFARRNLLGLVRPDEVNEGDDPPLVGTLIHNVLRNLFEPYLERPVKKGNISRSEILDALKDEMDALRIEERLPLDSLIMLELAAPRKLEKYLSSLPDVERVFRLEHQVQGEIRAAGKPCKLRGKIDRMDVRSGDYYLLDYKIGHVPEVRAEVWESQDFFDNLRESCNSGVDERGEELFLELRRALPSLQLPVYLHLLTREFPEGLANAAYVELRDEGKEKKLFPDFEEAQRQKALENCGHAAAFVINHMRSAPAFHGLEGACGWCEYRDMCLM